MITVIILAAGSSSRLGRPKQLLDLGGRPVLQHVIDAAAKAGADEIAIVVGHAADQVAKAVSLPPQARLVHNPDHTKGQSTSLRAGLLAANPAAGAVVILLGDQPGVRPDAIASVVEAWREGAGPVAQASYEGRPAHPTVFDRSVWPELGGAAGDEGARSLLIVHPEWVRPVEVGGQPPDDIDTEQDYARVRAAFAPCDEQPDRNRRGQSDP